MDKQMTYHPKRMILPLLALTLGMLACNLPFAGNPALNETATAQAATQTEVAARDLTATAPTRTPEPPANTGTPAPSETPSETATLTLSPTPTGPTYTVSQAVNCRNGPSTAFGIRFTLAVGDSVPITGRSNTAYWSNWWKVVYSGTECWVSDGFGSLSGNLSGVPVLNVATFTPTYTPTLTYTPTITSTPTVTYTPTP